MSKKTDATKSKDIAATLDMVNPMNPRLMLTFAHGRVLTLSPSMVKPEIATMAMMHGFKQKLVDAAAKPRNTANGASATIAEKYDAVKEVFDRLIEGQWNAERTGGTGNTGGLLAQAIARIKGKPIEQIREWLATKTDEEKKGLRANKAVADMIATIEAERLDPDIDADGLLDELDGMGE